MTHRTYTIGEASRLSGISVRRLRFYSDEGLLPPAGRTDSGYRMYTDADLVRLDLIRCLRDAGLGLAAIRNVLRRDLSLRAALRSPELTEADLRRYWTMTTLSRDERRTMIEQFYAQVAHGTGVDTDWMRQMIEASTPELPDNPSPEQCDAWIELADILKNPSFIANMRSNASELWGSGFDHEAYARASADIVSEAKAGIAEGLAPTSEIGGDLARRWFVTAAQLMGREPDRDFKAWLRQKYAAHDPRAARYWELVAILKGQPAGASPNREWNWIVEAMRHHLAGD